MTNADLIKILEDRLVEARAGRITDVVAVFGGPAGSAGAYAFTALDDQMIPILLGNYEVFKMQLIGLHLQRSQQRASGIVRAGAGAVPPIPPEIWKKMNGGG